ncbi:MAG: tRNA (guanosine(46)-N7)-methyltransferase TrmB [Eubacterium sp.]|nr:tRNA (guanosine(46)-N7)-methyltransferase TrmB [Eubacterium sp.]
MSRLRNIPGSVDVIRASEYVIHEPETHRGKWAEVFGNNRPLYIEIGMGKGRFLMDMAEKYPERNFIGIEMYDSVMFRAVQKAEMRTERARAELEGRDPESVIEIPAGVTSRPGRPENCNFRFIRMDARKLCEVFDEKEIDGIYLNFSDPWPKDRHEGRRLTSRNFLCLYEKVMKEEAVLEFKTDNRQLFDFSLEEIGDYGWDVKEHTFDLHHNEEMNRGNVMTEYEEKFSSKGNPICKLIAAPVR